MPSPLITEYVWFLKQSNATKCHFGQVFGNAGAWTFKFLIVFSLDKRQDSSPMALHQFWWSLCNFDQLLWSTRDWPLCNSFSCSRRSFYRLFLPSFLLYNCVFFLQYPSHLSILFWHQKSPSNPIDPSITSKFRIFGTKVCFALKIRSCLKASASSGCIAQRAATLQQSPEVDINFILFWRCKSQFSLEKKNWNRFLLQ